MGDAILTGAAPNIISSVVSVLIPPLIQLIDDVIHLDRNTQLLQAQLNRMKTLLLDITDRFQHGQRIPPDTVKNWLDTVRHSLDDAKRVLRRARQQKRCVDCSGLCRPRLSTQVREWKANFNQLFIDIQSDFSIFVNAQQIVSSAPVQSEALLQAVPESGYVGSGIKSGEMQLQAWLDNEDHHFRIIGVYGMGGIGKTSLLKTVYNAVKKKGKLFEAVIWTVVSQNSISDMQTDIAKQINLNLGSSSTVGMQLSGCLRGKKFLLILDDIWKDFDLEEDLGIPLGNDKGSRVVISTRSRDVVRRMGADDYSIQIQPLSTDEAWQLFCRGAFKAGTTPTKDIEVVATQIAGECNGLPLAINVVAAAMKGNTSVDHWHIAFNQMRNVDPDFLASTRIDEGLYQRLRLSYDRLPHSNIKNCFLFCATFSEDWCISVDYLVEMWIGEGLVNNRETSGLMDVGRRYVKLLEERCLFDTLYDNDDGTRYIKVHDVVHDMASYIAEKEEKCLFRTRQNLQKFPSEKGIENCKRIAIGKNNISVLPTDFRCPNLLTLILQSNESLREVPNGFLVHLTSLRVLDLDRTKIEALPISLWHLRRLEYLRLSNTLIKDLPEDICNLSQLQFLHLYGCRQLESLPCKIGELQNLKTLDIGKCCSLTGIPREISQLTSLNRLLLATSEGWEKSIMDVEEVKSGVCSLKDLANCPNLMELVVHVKPGIEVEGIRSGIQVGIMGSWVEMRDLKLVFDVEEHDVVEDLPQDMQNMKKLQILYLQKYHGRGLPNCISEFPQLEKLYLYSCFQIREIPPLEKLPNLRSLSLVNCIKMKELGITGGFPMLERLKLRMLPKLESMGSSSSSDVVWNEETMPKLQVLSITDCGSLKGLPVGIEKLPNLKQIEVEEDWWKESIWVETDAGIQSENDAGIVLKDKLNPFIVFV